MPSCKSCSAELTEAAAGASLFAMSFFTVGGQKLNRAEVSKIASKVGPLCPRCLWGRDDLPSNPGDDGERDVSDRDRDANGQNESNPAGEHADGAAE